MSFESDIKAFQAKALLAANKSVCKVVEEVFTQTVVLSPSPSNQGPYAKGLLANQYYTDVGGSFSGDITSATNPNGADSLSRIKATMASQPFFGKDNVVTLTNNTEEAIYAERLGWKKGEGTNGWTWSGTPAYGMVVKAVIATKAKYT